MTTAYAPMPSQRAIAREGYPFLVICALPAIAFAALGWVFTSAAFVCAFAFVTFFFRNPNREIPLEDGLILAPADGKVISVEKLNSVPFLEGEVTRLSIFMSVFNVHVNRMPVSATVREVSYRPGRFLVASLDKASEENESNTIIMEQPGGRKLAMTQIAGLVARRIVCYVKPGDFKLAGERFGLIRFGSRVDLYLPSAHTVNVSVGNKVRAGASIIGRWV